VRERQETLAETLHIVEGLWGDTPFTYSGKHFQVREANVRPGPMQQPYVPILLAGGGESVTLRNVAQFGDIANFGPDKRVVSAFTPADIMRKFDVLRQHCETLGRDYGSILRSYSAAPVLVAETQARLREKLDAIPVHIRQGYTSSTVTGTPDKICTYFQTLVNAGVRYFIVGLFGNDLETVRLLARWVVPFISEKTVEDYIHPAVMQLTYLAQNPHT
jgi:alkanesulfonate monooxygenase SsuD/methylene tetrahydromethanopterin reductase-like flavin-dependent oxidoreductase (luciferase family)